MRVLSTILLSLVLAGCNFADPLEFGGSENNTPNNETDSSNNNTTPDMDGDTTDSPFDVALTDVLVNGSELPTDVAALGDFEVTANVTAANSADCAGCKVQIVVAVADGGMGCLIDQVPTAEAMAGDVVIEAPPVAGGKELFYAAFQETDCAAAMARVTGETPTTILGNINFTAPAGLMVIAVTPVADGVDVPVDSTVRISFDGPVDAASVTNRVRIAAAGVQVPATVAVTGNEIILTPQLPLTEFQTVYTVQATSGITSGGRTLENDYMSTFTTRMFVPSVFYSASNEFHLSGFALGIDAANQCVIMPADQTAPAQRFRFVPRDDGWIAYNSAPAAATRALDGGDGVGNCGMTPLNATPASGQIWGFTRQQSGAFVIQNRRFGMAQSLDSTNQPPATAADLNCVPGSNACPRMQATTTVNRQFWRWTRLP